MELLEVYKGIEIYKHGNGYSIRVFDEIFALYKTLESVKESIDYVKKTAVDYIPTW
jgi:uncharacterized lipoprotein YehR (DUF1307 family)